MAAQVSLFPRSQLSPSRPRRGRPPKKGAGLPHTRRPEVDPSRPHHVTVRVRRHVWNLRSQRCFGPVRRALEAVRARAGFRVVHFSVQGDHVHLVTEADDRRAMTNGMRALLIRVAKQLNRLMGTRGRLFADRFHERVLRTPTETRNVIRYVLGNRARHTGRSAAVADRFSSAVACEVVSAPSSWLLARGWRRGRDPTTGRAARLRDGGPSYPPLP